MKRTPNSGDLASHQLVLAIKRRLKTDGLTYQALAREMGLSEVTVKRLLTGKRLTLERLQGISGALRIPLSELMKEAEEAVDEEPFQLSESQELALAGDVRLCSFFIYLVYRVPLRQILLRFKVSRTQAEKYLLKLNRVGLIELHRNLKFKVLVPHGFQWKKDGPLEKRILNPLSKALLGNSSGRSQQRAHEFYITRMTPALITEFTRRFRVLSEELIIRSIREESGHPDAKNVGFLLVLRPFEGSVIRLLDQASP